MKDTIHVKKTIKANANAVWATIAAGSGVNRWFPAVSTCRVEGDQRYCTLAGGGDLVETIRAVDQMSHTFKYTVDQHPLPVGPVSCSMQIIDAGMGETTIIWIAELEGEAEGVKAVKEMVSAMYEQGIASLESYQAAMA
jgi:uncharacterized protein YndB with AHSA1/START domain